MGVSAFSGVTSSNNEGSTTIEAARARKTIRAVRMPKAENMGMGANPRMANPSIEETAEAARAMPVPLAALRKAFMRLSDLASSS